MILEIMGKGTLDMEPIKNRKHGRRMWILIMYDALILLGVCSYFLILSPSTQIRMSPLGVALNILLCCACVFIGRWLGGMYKQVWRYGTNRAYILLMLLDTLSGIAFWMISTADGKHGVCPCGFTLFYQPAPDDCHSHGVSVHV